MSDFFVCSGYSRLHSATFFCLTVITVFFVGFFPHRVWAAEAHVHELFLNQVNIEGVVNQKIENCTVEIDAKGNVWITAKGYRVESKSVSPSNKAEEKVMPSSSASQVGAGPANSVESASLKGVLQKRYWLISDKPYPGLEQYDLDVRINGSVVAHIDSAVAMNALEVTSYFKAGANQVEIVATKRVDATTPRKSVSPLHYHRLSLGVGRLNEQVLVIEKTLFDYRRTAAESTNFTDRYSVEVQ